MICGGTSPRTVPPADHGAQDDAENPNHRDISILFRPAEVFREKMMEEM